MCVALLAAQTENMSSAINELTGFSEALVELVTEAKQGVVAVKAAAYRVVSGLVIDEQHVAVADHALRREDRVPIFTADGRESIATILGRDPAIDLAILKAPGHGLKPLATAEPSSLQSGMLVLVVGLTVDVGPSASLGILGAVGGRPRGTWRGGTLDQFLRLDVNLYPSQSGAAVVDAKGRAIGMATPALSRHSTIALPISTIQRVMKELSKEGRIRHGYLGVGLQTVAIPANLRSKVPGSSESGLIVLSIEPDSPADKGGLQLGDILMQLDGKIVSEVDELQTALRGEAVGKTVKALVVRGGEPVEVAITIVERAKAERSHREN